MERRPARRPRTRDRAAANAATLLSFVALLGGVVVAQRVGSTTPAHTQADCVDLARQYDVAAPAHHAAPRAEEAQRERTAAAEACEAGRYTEGVEALRRALHAIGVKPVRLTATPRP